MNKKNPPANRSVTIGGDAAGNVIVTGDGNVVTLGVAKAAERQNEGTSKVFISSTSEDLGEYRKAAHDAAIAAGILPIQMEYFAASGEHPPLQACLQKVSEADVLVSIVAYRYGWVPPDQKDGEHKSITWLECEKACADGKEVLAFVVDTEHPWNPELKEEYQIAAAIETGNATAKLLNEVKRNVNGLKGFKAWIDGLGVRARFTNPESLRAKVSEALAEWKHRHRQRPPKPSAKAGSGVARPKQRPPAFPPTYREWLQQQCADVDLLGVRLKQGQAVRLNHVYVPLTTTAIEKEPRTGGRSRNPLEEHKEVLRMRGRDRRNLLLEQLDKASLYVPGDPGSGKSTFCRWVAWLVAAGAMPEAEVIAPEDYAESFPQALAGRLPVVVRLRDVWRYLPRDPGRDSLSRAELESALGNWLDTTSPGGLEWADVVPHLEQGSALLIFDGVDEVPLREGEGRNACYPRAALIAGLVDGAPVWQAQGNRLLVTSRPYGFDERQTGKLALQHAQMRELDSTLQELLIRRWFHILQDDADKAEEIAADMRSHLAQRTELDALTANPMLLTSMCIIYDEGKRLPQDKHDLYERIVDNVLYNRYRNDPGELELAREHLGVVAYDMHTGAGLGEQRTTPQAEASYKEIEKSIETYHQESTVTYSGYVGAIETRDELLQRSGLLLGRGEKKAGFYHLTFQDFLAARRLADVEEARLFEVFCERAEIPEWRNALSFVFGSKLANSKQQATGLLNRLIDRLTPDSLGLAVVVADCLETMLGRENRLREDVERKFKEICLAAIENEVELKARNALGLALGRLGDPRIVVDLRVPSAYVEIPAGEYAYQDGRQTIEQPFLLSKYPVTNTQFALFLAEGGYQDSRFWTEEGWKWKEGTKTSEPDRWRDSRYNAPNQPVVGVSFYEAQAFCKWAGGFLPSERQWEAAACGSEGFEYPWGGPWEDGICNTEEAGLDVTSPAGLFPRSRQQVLKLEDMAGNVWEWCDSLYKEDSKGRVLRGGSFYINADDARATIRLVRPPDIRYYSFGFRAARTYT